MSLLDSAVNGPIFHAGQVGNTYSQHPEQAALGINTPAEAYVWNNALGTNYKPVVNMYGGPTEEQYANAQRQGIDMTANRVADAVVPAVASGMTGGMAGAAMMYGNAALKNAQQQDMMMRANNNRAAQMGYSGYQPMAATGNYAKGGLTEAAKHLAAKGRGKDDNLVHMSNNEIAGLQAIARAKGGSLTINPKTGLPEAGFLEDVLPIAATAALMYFGGPAGMAIGDALLPEAMAGSALSAGLGMGIMSGGLTTLMTGDINKGLKAGLISGVAAGAINGLSGPSTAEVPTANVKTDVPAMNNIDPWGSQAGTYPQNVPTPANVPNAPNVPKMDPYEVQDLQNASRNVNAPAGSAEAINTGTATKTGLNLTPKEILGYGLAGSAALSLLGSQNQGGTSAQQQPGMIRPYTFAQNQQQANYLVPKYDSRGLPVLDSKERQYFAPQYTALTPYKTNETNPNANNPIVQMTQPFVKTAAVGGLMQNEMYPQSQQEHTNFAESTQYPNSMRQMMGEGYDTPVNPLTGEDISQKMMKSGGITGYSGGEDSDVKSKKFDFEELQRKSMLWDFALNPMARRVMPGGDIGKTAQQIQEETQGIPLGAYGRIGATKEFDDKSSLRGGLSGMLMQAPPGEAGVRGIPGTMDVGYNRPVGQGQLDISAYRSLMQNPGGGYNQGVNARYTLPFNEGGSLGSYSDGGHLLKGPGDGVSDDIPANIGGHQPARLADGEFVIPARIVSELGNGSTDAGAKRLYAMMDDIQNARKETVKGGKSFAKDTKAYKYLPKTA